MKKRLLAAVLAAVMAASSLTGCASQTETTAEPTKEAQASTEAKTEAPVTETPTTQAPATEAPITQAPATETPVTEAPATEAPVTEAPATKEAETEAPETAESAAEEEIELPEEIMIPDIMMGGVMMIEEMDTEVEDLSEDDQAEMDRAMRAYTPGGSTLLINNAKEFYYYSQMGKDSQALYDGMLMVAEDPTNANNIVKVVISTDPTKSEFSDVWFTAYFGLLYDHAELFWLYNGISSDFVAGAPYFDDAPAGKHSVYIRLSQPYANYKKEMNAFNDAVDEFLSDIDLNASDARIALEIHDKLVDLVTYDTEVMEKGSHYNYAHTAYGALVADSEGIPNYAVCDGYSQAYVYLLQQAGINAALIIGLAGSDRSSAGGHAWSVVELDGEWYEVDSTWNDIGTREYQAEQMKNRDKTSYELMTDALKDPQYRDLLQHFMFNLTTDALTNFQRNASHVFVNSARRCTYTLVSNSVHIRATPGLNGVGYYGYAVRLAPVATGTLHAYQ